MIAYDIRVDFFCTLYRVFFIVLQNLQQNEEF
jgi:hypothetical protein